jgi:hypothetical protein
VFKALADPVRLWPVSLIGAHQGGEVIRRLPILSG